MKRLEFIKRSAFIIALAPFFLRIKNEEILQDAQQETLQASPYTLKAKLPDGSVLDVTDLFIDGKEGVGNTVIEGRERTISMEDIKVYS